MALMEQGTESLGGTIGRFALPRIEERHRTITLNLPGRFMRENRTEYAAQLNRISVARLVVAAPITVLEGERIIAYFDHLGGLEGRVAELVDGGFTMCLNITTHKREKLAAQLTWLINRAEDTGLEARRHERFAVANKTVPLRVGEAEGVECMLLDISISGASVKTTMRPTIGTEVVVGKQRAVVRRHHEQGIGVQFLYLQDAGNLNGFLGR